MITQYTSYYFVSQLAEKWLLSEPLKKDKTNFPFQNNCDGGSKAIVLTVKFIGFLLRGLLTFVQFVYILHLQYTVVSYTLTTLYTIHITLTLHCCQLHIDSTVYNTYYTNITLLSVTHWQHCIHITLTLQCCH